MRSTAGSTFAAPAPGATRWAATWRSTRPGSTGSSRPTAPPTRRPSWSATRKPTPRPTPGSQGCAAPGDRLQAKLRDIAPPFREAVEAGRYAGRSIALQGDTLRHVGFLGGRAPAVPGLAPTQFAARPEAVISFYDEARLASGSDYAGAWSSLARVFRGLRERIIAADGREAADAAIPDYEIEALAELARRAADGDADGDRPLPVLASLAPAPAPDPDPDPDPDSNPDNGTEGAMPKTDAELAAEAAELDERRTALDADKAEQDRRETALAAREAAQLAADRRREAEALLKPHIEAGRVLPAETAGLAALLASLPEGDDAVLTFAAPGDGAGELREAPAKVLDAFLAGLPKRVTYDTLAGGAPPTPDGETSHEEAQDIGAEAHRLLASAHAKGERLTTQQAVDQVRAKRGLTGQGS